MSKSSKDLSVVWGDEAAISLIQVRRYLSFAVELANKQGYYDARSLSHAKTHVDEALLWLTSGMHTTYENMFGEYATEQENREADIAYINEWHLYTSLNQ